MAEPFNAVDPVRKTFFINESERDAGTPANDVGKVAQLEGDGLLAGAFQRNSHKVDSLTTSQDIDGSTTPQAAMIQTDGLVAKAKADDGYLDKFIGFVAQNISNGNKGAYLNGTTSTSPTFSHTVNAGTKRVVVVFTAQIAEGGSENTNVPSAAPTWDGNTMTLIDSQIVSDAGAGKEVAVSAYIYAAGDSGANQTGDVAITIAAPSGNATNAYYMALNFEYIDQSSPVLDGVAKGQLTVNSNIDVNIEPGVSPSMLVQFAGMNAGVGETFTEETGFTRQLEITPSGNREGAFAATNISDIAGNNTITAQSSSAGNIKVSLVVSLRYSETVEAPVSAGNVLGGFSGLTPGERYYVQNTAGEIGITPGSTTILVGKALSATELLILHD